MGETDGWKEGSNFSATCAESRKGRERARRPESGVNAAGRDLGMDRTEAQRSVKIAAIAPEAKEAAREAGLDNEAAEAGMSITPAEVRSARALLGWTQRDLARRAVISVSVVSAYETRKARPAPSTVRNLQRTLEAAGVEFIAENGEGAGVRLRKAK